jgi:hypothetical protein
MQRLMEPVRQKTEGFLLRGMFSGNRAINGPAAGKHGGLARADPAYGVRLTNRILHGLLAFPGR